MSVILGIIIFCIVIWRLSVILELVVKEEFWIGVFIFFITLVLFGLDGTIRYYLLSINGSYISEVVSFLEIFLLNLWTYFLIKEQSRHTDKKCIPLKYGTFIIMAITVFMCCYALLWWDWFSEKICPYLLLLSKYLLVIELVVYTNSIIKIRLKENKLPIVWSIIILLLMVISKFLIEKPYPNLGPYLDFFYAKNIGWFLLYWLPFLFVCLYSRCGALASVVGVNLLLLGLIVVRYDSAFDDGGDLIADNDTFIDNTSIDSGISDYITPSPMDNAADLSSTMIASTTDAFSSNNNFSAPDNSSNMQTVLDGDGSTRSFMVNQSGDSTAVLDLSSGDLTTYLNDGTILNSLGISDGRIDMTNMNDIKIFDANNSLAYTIENNIIFDKLHQVAYTIQDGTLFDANHKLIARFA